MATQAPASDVYANYVNALVTAEAARKSSLEQRGVGVVTTSGTLVTLLFALIGVVTSSKTFSLPVQTHGWLAAAIILFALAVALGLLANCPLFYSEATPTPEQLADVWHYSEPDAQAFVIATQVPILNDARRANQIKGWLVLAAAGIQLAALVMLVVAVLLILK